jgi:hypothetical protein
VPQLVPAFAQQMKFWTVLAQVRGAILESELGFGLTVPDFPCVPEIEHLLNVLTQPKSPNANQFPKHIQSDAAPTSSKMAIPKF